MYKIENAEFPTKAVYLSGSGLYEIVKKERAISAAAALYDPNDIENSFNKLVAAAAENYNTFMAEIWVNQNDFEIEVLTNFEEFFEILIDIKKKESENIGEAVEGAVPVADEDSPPEKKLKKNKK